MRPQPPGTVADCDQQSDTDIRCGKDDSHQADIRGKVKYRHLWLIAAQKKRRGKHFDKKQKENSFIFRRK